MYFPYLRGKQYEFIAVRELFQKNLVSKNGKINVIPIFEPVSNIFNYFDKFIQNNIIFGIIINPKVGEAESSLIQSYISKNSVYSNYFFICILVNSNNQNEVIRYKNFYKNFNKIYIHEKYNPIFAPQMTIFNDGNYNIISTSIPNNYSLHLNNKILLEDSFNKEARNSDYPIESYFNNYYYTYNQQGYIGVSDFLTIGNNYTKTGGQPYAVALHLSIEKNRSIYIRHFISDSIDTRGDAGNKFLEALPKLVNFVLKNNIIKTDGVNDFLDWNYKKHFPGLGSIKKASMKNHIELLSKLI